MEPGIVGRCWHCGHELSEFDLGREARCPGCAKAVHACRNCRFFSPGRSNDCLEPVADHVADKTGANFCDYFEPHRDAHKGRDDAPERLREAAEALFKSD